VQRGANALQEWNAFFKTRFRFRDLALLSRSDGVGIPPRRTERDRARALI
jgi:hypothetical protein